MPKKEYISKDYALYLVNYFGNMQTWSKEDIVSEIKRKIVEADVDLPSADVVPVRHGEWYYSYTTITEVKMYICSKCRSERPIDKYDNIEEYEYCPHCGAKMDGG